MYSRWTKGLNDQQKKDFNAQVVAAYPAMKALIALIEEDVRASERQIEDKEKYSLAAWPYFQADQIGEQRAYKKVLKLVKNLYKEEK